MNFRQTLTRSLSKGIAWMALIVCAFVMANVFSTTTVAERPLPAASPAAVMAECETAENGENIRYAVIQRLNSGAEKVYSQKAIYKAVNDVLGKDWKNVRVIGFCE